ncbi:hypothetical protein [Nocardia xishanensis]
MQAKRCYGLTYPQLKHKVHSIRQDKVLINECADDGLGYLPYHVFYNGWEAARFEEYGRDDTIGDALALKYNDHFPHRDWQPILMQAAGASAGGRTSGPAFAVARLGSENPRWWGCAALSSYTVNALLRAKRDKYHVLRYLEHAMPWSKLFSTSRELYPNVQVPARYTSPTDVIHWRLLADTDHSREMEGSRPRAQPPLESRRIPELPAYVRSLFRMSKTANDAYLNDLSADYAVLDRTRPHRIVVTDLHAPEFKSDRI